MARVSRLYPVYLLAIVISIPLHQRLPTGVELFIFPMLQSWVPPVSSMGYSWIVPAWTLSVEAFFYCCFPVFLLLFRRKWSSSILWVFAAFLFALNVALRVPLFHPFIPSTWLTSHIILPVLSLPGFLLGMVLGALFLRKQSLAAGSATNDWITAAGILACCSLIAAGVGDTLLSFAAVGCFSWSIYRLADGRGWLTNLLSSRVMLLLGGASYSVYLLQTLIREITHKAVARFHPGLDAALSPVILICLCSLIFLFYEEPLRDIVRKLLLRGTTSSKVGA